MNANDRLAIATVKMRKNGIPIPPRVLRDALDESRAILRSRPGLHDTTITITESTTKEITSLFGEIPRSTILRVAGQRFGRNSV